MSLYIDAYQKFDFSNIHIRFLNANLKNLLKI